jgi:hypothetical protein
MFVDVILVHVMQMTIVKIVDMAVMPDRGVAAVRAVLMGMVVMVLFGAGHKFSFRRWRSAYQRATPSPPTHQHPIK